MTVLDGSAGLGDIVHGAGAELTELAVRARLVVTLLVCGEEQILLVTDHIIFELAHSLELHSGHLLEGFLGLFQDIFGRGLQRLAVLCVIGAHQAQCGDFRKRIHKGGAETGNHIEVAGSGLHKGEEARTIDTLAIGKNLVQVITVCQDKIQGFQPPVARHITEVEHTDFVLLNVTDNVRFCEILRILVQELNQGVHTDFLFFELFHID